MKNNRNFRKQDNLKRHSTQELFQLYSSTKVSNNLNGTIYLDEFLESTSSTEKDSLYKEVQ